METRRDILWQWIQQGHIPAARADDALRLSGVIPDRKRWKVFIEDLLLWLGAMALVISVLYLVAYNWEAMGRFIKFALVELLIVTALVVYWFYSSHVLVSKLLLTMASILTGVLLALYGQIYQTGADPWQLFANWALLILPWVIIARFATLWFVWLVLVNVAIVLYSTTFLRLFGFLSLSELGVLWPVFAVNTLAWATWEGLSARFSWLNERWAVRLIAIASGWAITSLATMSVFTNEYVSAWAIPVYLLWLAALVFIYLKLRPDLFMLAGACLSASVFIIASLLDRMLDGGGDEAAVFFLLVFVVIGLASASAAWLRKVHKEIRS